ncbi:phosphatase PAP2 family protein [Eudoraea chungangensis]|uniref:phosphatase PAP2 family protein n=1 Tax=Eudoraea chungangensis TaxID=1481905 RepID=UPI0023EC4CB7|nr:phosphatase PAP2 family protein [Eudoraea chungangensis]
MFKDILIWDKRILIYLNNLGSESYDLFWINTTDIASWIPLIISLIVFVFIRYPKKRASIIISAFVILLLFTLGFTDLTKSYFERLRPNNDMDIKPLIRVLVNARGFSFFSGHASSSFAMTSFAILLFREKNKWVWSLLFWPIIFAYSRIYVGVHFPSDILVGAVVGIFFAYIFYAIFNYLIALYKV